MQKKLSLLAALAVCLIGLRPTASRGADLPVQDYTTTLNGAQIAYTITGSGSQTIFLIHGYPLNGNLFANQRQALGASYRVITMDIRGFGRSVSPDDQGSIDIYANDALALLNQLGISKAIIGGHSLGGAVVVKLYELAPALFSGLILNDAAVFPPSIVEQNMWLGYQTQTREGGDKHGFIGLLLPEFLTGKTRASQPDLVAEVSAEIRAATPNGMIGGAQALQTRGNLTPIFATISVPTLILEGQEDSLTPMEQAKKLHRMISGSQLNIVPGATHGVITEAADTANSIILDWLSANF